MPHRGYTFGRAITSRFGLDTSHQFTRIIVAINTIDVNGKRWKRREPSRVPRNKGEIKRGKAAEEERGKMEIGATVLHRAVSGMYRADHDRVSAPLVISVS